MAKTSPFIIGEYLQDPAMNAAYRLQVALEQIEALPPTEELLAALADIVSGRATEWAYDVLTKLKTVDGDGSTARLGLSGGTEARVTEPREAKTASPS